MMSAIDGALAVSLLLIVCVWEGDSWALTWASDWVDVLINLCRFLQWEWLAALSFDGHWAWFLGGGVCVEFDADEMSFISQYLLLVKPDALSHFLFSFLGMQPPSLWNTHTQDSLYTHTHTP